MRLFKSIFHQECRQKNYALGHWPIRGEGVLAKSQILLITSDKDRQYLPDPSVQISDRSKIGYTAFLKKHSLIVSLLYSIYIGQVSRTPFGKLDMAI